MYKTPGCGTPYLRTGRHPAPYASASLSFMSETPWKLVRITPGPAEATAQTESLTATRSAPDDCAGREGDCFGRIYRSGRQRRLPPDAIPSGSA
jgi:hypothetical protein